MAKSIRRQWTDEERLSALKIYCELKFSELSRTNPSIIELSKKINRTPSAVGMKLCNFAHLDPDVEQKGLTSVSKADRLLMERFVLDRDSVIAESKKAFEKLEKKFSNALEYTPPDSIDKKTEQTAEIKIRTLQGKYRERILAVYGQKCTSCS
ncbi:MAG: hypothetical protein K8953_13120, partial [Proteobacteria bacterium]|nr:hypothetical protein [Pseudomonadota bacterium]